MAYWFRMCVCVLRLNVPLSWLTLDFLRGGSVIIAPPVIYSSCLARLGKLYSPQKIIQVSVPEELWGCRLPSNSVRDQPVLTWHSQDPSDRWPLSRSSYSLLKISEIDDAQLPCLPNSNGWLVSKVKRLAELHYREISVELRQVNQSKIQACSDFSSFFFLRESTGWHLRAAWVTVLIEAMQRSKGSRKLSICTSH